jgi:hypothetical protein
MAMKRASMLLGSERGGGGFPGCLVARSNQDRYAGAADLACDFKSDPLVRSRDERDFLR